MSDQGPSMGAILSSQQAQSPGKDIQGAFSVVGTGGGKSLLGLDDTELLKGCALGSHGVVNGFGAGGPLAFVGDAFSGVMDSDMTGSSSGDGSWSSGSSDAQAFPTFQSASNDFAESGARFAGGLPRGKPVSPDPTPSVGAGRAQETER